MHYFIVTVSSETAKGDHYLVRCKINSPEAAVRYIQKEGLVQRYESCKAEPATLESVVRLLDWQRINYTTVKSAI